MIKRILDKLFRRTSDSDRARTVSNVSMVVQSFLSGNVRRLSDAELTVLVEHLLGTPEVARSLHGNAPYLRSIPKSFQKHGRLTLKQRNGLYNVLERALPHNVIAGLLRQRDQ